MKQFLFIAALLTVLNGYGQSVASYLSAHHADLSTEPAKNDPVFNARFYKNQLFIAGEIHGIKSGQDIDYFLLTLLNKKVNMTTYVAEFDFSKAYFLNKYLTTGDESLIDSVFSDWAEQNAQWANTDFQRKIKKIRSYNLTLKPKQRIHFEGIDQIQNPVLVARYFKELLQDQQFSKIRSSFAPLINALVLKNDSLIINTAQKITQTLKEKAEPRLSGNKTNELLFALTNCLSVKKSRETVITDNFKQLFKIKNWKDQKLYGFLGFAHVLQSRANDSKNSFLANRLENDTSLPLKGKIASIALIYVDSKMTTPTFELPAAWQNKGKRYTTFDQFNHDGPLIKLDGIEEFKAITKSNTLTIFDLAAPSSPYLTKSLDIHYASIMPAELHLLLNEKGKMITDYFQYLVLVRNSAPTNPILP